MELKGKGLWREMLMGVVKHIANVGAASVDQREKLGQPGGGGKRGSLKHIRKTVQHAQSVQGKGRVADAVGWMRKGSKAQALGLRLGKVAYADLCVDGLAAMNCENQTPW